MGSTCRTSSSFLSSFGSERMAFNLWNEDMRGFSPLKATYACELQFMKRRYEGGEEGFSPWNRPYGVVSGTGGRSWGLEFRKEKSGRYVKFWKPEPSLMATGWKLLVKIPVSTKIGQKFFRPTGKLILIILNVLSYHNAVIFITEH